MVARSCTARRTGKLLWLYDIGTRTWKAITRPSGLAADVALSVDAVSANGRFVVVTGGTARPTCEMPSTARDGPGH